MSLQENVSRCFKEHGELRKELEDLKSKIKRIKLFRDRIEESKVLLDSGPYPMLPGQRREDWRIPEGLLINLLELIEEISDE